MTNLLALLKLLVALARVLGITPLQIAEMCADTDACQAYYDEMLSLINGDARAQVN